MGLGPRREIHARERDVGSSAIPEVMEWNEITDRECGMKEKRTRAELGKRY